MTEIEACAPYEIALQSSVLKRYAPQDPLYIDYGQANKHVMRKQKQQQEEDE